MRQMSYPIHHTSHRSGHVAKLHRVCEPVPEHATHIDVVPAAESAAVRCWHHGYEGKGAMQQDVEVLEAEEVLVCTSLHNFAADTHGTGTAAQPPVSLQQPQLPQYLALPQP